MTFTSKSSIFLKNLGITTCEAKMSYYREYNVQIIGHFLARPNMSY